MKKSVILISFLFLMLVSCGQNETRSYSEYSDFFLDDIDNFYQIEEEHYFIDLYQIECSHCENVKTNLFNYLDELESGEKSLKIFLFDLNSGDGGIPNRNKFKVKGENYDRNILIREMEQAKPKTLNETYYFGTPSLYEIKDGKFENLYLGENEINGFLNSL